MKVSLFVQFRIWLCRKVAPHGWAVTVLPPDPDGLKKVYAAKDGRMYAWDGSGFLDVTPLLEEE